LTRGRIFNVQRFSVHDGPGIRTTVFLKGCPLRCLWCHNPESIRGELELVRFEGRCLHCRRCVEACPTGRLAALERGEVDSAPECILCGTCAEVCPAEARQLVGRWVTVDELLSEVLRDRIFFDDSGGGVTFSGGEPLSQPEFLAAALEACRGAGVRTAVDTSGFCRLADLLRIASWADLFLFDLKHMDDTRHRELTGVSNERILENLSALAGRLAASGGGEGGDETGIRIRVPVIPGMNDDPANLAAVARFAASLPGVHRVDLLPYHAHGLGKLGRLGAAPPTEAIAPVDPAHLDQLAAIVRGAGLEPRAGA
jgi:pyruvate formate lyase activating enzyme